MNLFDGYALHLMITVLAAAESAAFIAGGIRADVTAAGAVKSCVV